MVCFDKAMIEWINGGCELQGIQRRFSGCRYWWEHNKVGYIKGVTTMVGYLMSITIGVVHFSMLSQSMARLWTSQSYWTQKNCTLEKIYLLRSYFSDSKCLPSTKNLIQAYSQLYTSMNEWRKKRIKTIIQWGKSDNQLIITATTATGQDDTAFSSSPWWCCKLTP